MLAQPVCGVPLKSVTPGYHDELKGYLESSLQWFVNKTSNEKKKLYTKINTLKLLLNVVTTRIEGFVISRNNFCMLPL
jgi:hypothetical protein